MTTYVRLSPDQSATMDLRSPIQVEATTFCGYFPHVYISRKYYFNNAIYRFNTIEEARAAKAVIDTAIAKEMEMVR